MINSLIAGAYWLAVGYLLAEGSMEVGSEQASAATA